MKKKYIFYIILLGVATTFASCDMFKVADKYAPKIQSPGSIQFQVAEGALTGTGLTGVVQPSFDVAAARFSKATTASPNYFAGNAVVTINITSPLTNVTVNLLYTTSAGAIVREQKATFTGVSGSVTWTQALTNIGPASAPNPSPPAAGTGFTYEVVASDSGGTKVNSRVFALTVLP